MTAAAVTLMVAGTALELAGIVLIALEIRSDRRRATAIVSRGRVVSGAAEIRGRARMSARASGGTEPSLDVRVGLLEERVGSLAEDLERKLDGLEERLGQRLSKVSGQIDRESAERDLYLRRFLGEMLAGDLGRRRLGVALLITGLLVATVGNLLGVAG